MSLLKLMLIALSNAGFVRLHDAATGNTVSLSPGSADAAPRELRSLPSPQPLPTTTPPAAKTPSN